jgi:hypothetical protein
MGVPQIRNRKACIPAYKPTVHRPEKKLGEFLACILFLVITYYRVPHASGVMKPSLWNLACLWHSKFMGVNDVTHPENDRKTIQCLGNTNRTMAASPTGILPGQRYLR